MPTKNTMVAIRDAGRFVESSSVATLASDDTEFTIEGQMLRAISNDASL